jgi:hypothetical protein
VGEDEALPTRPEGDDPDEKVLYDNHLLDKRSLQDVIQFGRIHRTLLPQSASGGQYHRRAAASSERQTQRLPWCLDVVRRSETKFQVDLSDDIRPDFMKWYQYLLYRQMSTIRERNVSRPQVRLHGS